MWELIATGWALNKMAETETSYREEKEEEIKEKTHFQKYQNWYLLSIMIFLGWLFFIK